MPPAEDIGTLIATPAIWTPDMSDDQWEEQLDLMLNRAIAAHEFITGRINGDDFADALHDYGFDPAQCFEHWDNGLTYLF